MKKLLLISTLFVFLVACNSDDSKPENKMDVNEEHEEMNDELANDIITEDDGTHNENNDVSPENQYAELDHETVELIDVNQYTGILKEHAQLINDYVTYQNNRDDESLSKIVGGIVPKKATRSYKILKVEIDEELSYVRENEGLYFVEVNITRSPGEQIYEYSTRFVFEKIDDEWIIVNN